jgi:TRAP-type mannitol/chloroaromatic compound transport system substrate-binding protein
MTLTAIVLAGCSQTAGSQQTSGTAAPAQQYVLKMQTTQANNQIEFKMLTQMSEELLKASGGRVKVEVYPLGTFASSLESFQACMNGVFDICSNYGTWLKSIDYALHVLTTGNMQMDPIAKRIWLYEYGGIEIAERAFAKANLVFLAMHTDGTEVMMARELVRNVDQLKNKKFRTSDARLLNAVGIAGVTMPLEELFTAFQTGAVDIAEYGYLAFDQQLGLTDVAKYAVYPDFWNVHNSLSIAINKDSYAKLPEDVQILLKMAFRSYEFKHFSATQFASAQTMKELQESGKMQFARLNSEEFAGLRKLMYETIEAADIKEYGGLTKEVFESQYAFMKIWYPYKKISRWWGEDLTPEEMMGFK